MSAHLDAELQAEAVELVRKHRMILVMVPQVKHFLVRLAARLEWTNLTRELAR